MRRKNTGRKVKEIIEKYIDLFDVNGRIPDFIFIGKNAKDLTEGGFARVTGPIDGMYALGVNTKDYEFTEEALENVILHELIHYKLLLEDKQPKGDAMHDGIFEEIANNLEVKLNRRGINCKTPYNMMSIKRKKRYDYLIVLHKDSNFVCIKIKEKDLFEWLKIIPDCDANYVVYKTRRTFSDAFPYTEVGREFSGCDITDVMEMTGGFDDEEYITKGIGYGMCKRCSKK